MSKARTDAPRSLTPAPRREVDGSLPEGHPHGPLSPVEAAAYIGEFAAELAQLARQADLEVLAYLLDMARLEAAQIK